MRSSTSPLLTLEEEVGRLQLAEIPADQLTRLLAQLTALASQVAARLAAAPAPSKWRTVAWAAEQSGLSVHYFYERAQADHPDALPFLRRRGRVVRVEEAPFFRWLRRRG